jgi:drug/metabolite transporter (DMT)-like permease
VIHAVWNLLLAGARDPEAATAVALVSAGLVVAPLALWRWELDSEAVPFLVASAALQLAYFALLAAAYRRAELSVVYPLARGLAPVLVLVGAVVFTGAGTSAAQVLGVALVASGILLVRGLRRGHGVWLGIAIAVLIAAYTVVDKHGVAHASPLTYVWVITLVPGLVYAATRKREALRRAFEPRAVIAGIASLTAYGLVLAALKLAPAASVAAVRESSVVIATALAAVVLKERVTAWRLSGAALVVTGVILLGA